jgi:antitoxin HicB
MTTKKGLLAKSGKTMDISKKPPEDYLKEPYARILIPEADGTFSAELLEFPGCFSQGDSPNEAFRNLEEAAKSWIEAALDQGQEIPPPSANHGYSGKIALRLPRSLHRLAMRKAERDNVSLNQCLVTAIASWVGADDVYTRYAERLSRLSATTTSASLNITVNYLALAMRPTAVSIDRKTAATVSSIDAPSPGLTSWVTPVQSM